MTEQEFLNFLNASPSFLVAPAGYGKTHTIAQSVKFLKDKNVNKILVLTHTNAGISSIREKFQKELVSLKSVNIFTIAGFLQKIVFSLSKDGLPNDEDYNVFYSKLYDSSLELFKHNEILKFVIENSYSHIFIDEFQDCNRKQFKIIKELCKWNVNVHILIDPLQSIFAFEDNHPNYFRLEKFFRNHNANIFQLDTPQRWERVNSPLGQYVDNWRNLISNAIDNRLSHLDFNQLKGVEYSNVDFESAIHNINELLNVSKDLLVLHSNSGINNVESRGQICIRTRYKLRLIESIDNVDFHLLANTIDQALSSDSNVISVIYKIMSDIRTSKTNLEQWIKPDRLVNKRSQEDKALSLKLQTAIDNQSKKRAIVDSINILMHDIKLNFQRAELLYEIKSAIESSIISGKTIKEEIFIKRNLARIQGRKIKGNVIGTTLLTKGLEADTVLLLKPSDLFLMKNGLKHLYVALTRAVNRIILIDYS